MTKIIKFENWINYSDEMSLRELRRMVGLPELSVREVKCKRCSAKMMSDYSGNRRVEFFCHYCRSHIARQNEGLI